MNLRDEVIQRMTRVILIRPLRHALVVRLAVNRWAALKVVHYRFGEALPTPPRGPSGATKDHRSANARSAAALQMANQVWRIVWISPPFIPRPCVFSMLIRVLDAESGLFHDVAPLLASNRDMTR
jgi:hypothetical protein